MRGNDDRGVFAEVALPVGAGFPDNPLAGAVGDEMRKVCGDVAGEGLHGRNGERDAVGEDVERDEGGLAVVREVVGDDHVLLRILREGDVGYGREMANVRGECRCRAEGEKSGNETVHDRVPFLCLTVPPG